MLSAATYLMFLMDIVSIACAPLPAALFWKSAQFGFAVRTLSKHAVWDVLYVAAAMLLYLLPAIMQ
jgi:hypothetical protein